MYLNKNIKYDIGCVFDSVNYGKFEIIDVNKDENKYKIKFLNTGSIREYAGTSAIKDGLVRDLEQDHCKQKYKIGDIYEGNKGKLFEIVDFVEVDGKRKVKVRFLDTGYETVVFVTNIPMKTITDKSTDDWGNLKYKPSTIITSKSGISAKILDLERRKQSNGRIRNYITVEILNTGFILQCTPDNFIRDKFKDLLTPTVFGHGKLGYIDSIVEENQCLLRDIKEYRIWAGMIERACCEHTEKELSYNDVTIDERWLRFDYFYEDVKEIPNYIMWKRFQQEYPNVKNIFELDKDFLIKGNKNYSKEACIFLPKFINAGYNSWATEETKNNLLKNMEGLDYESIIKRARELQYL